MSEAQKIVYTACATLLGGSLLYIFSQAVTKGLLEPYLDYRKVLGEITHSLIFHANNLVSGRYPDEPQRHQKISEEVRELSCKLRAAITRLPLYWLLRAFLLVPSRASIHHAAGLLIRISNLACDTDKKYDTVYEDIREVGHALKIDTGRDPRKPFKRRAS